MLDGGKNELIRFFFLGVVKVKGIKRMFLFFFGMKWLRKFVEEVVRFRVS